jgi:hypothetical protein
MDLSVHKGEDTCRAVLFSLVLSCPECFEYCAGASFSAYFNGIGNVFYINDDKCIRIAGVVGCESDHSYVAVHGRSTGHGHTGLAYPANLLVEVLSPPDIIAAIFMHCDGGARIRITTNPEGWSLYTCPWYGCFYLRRIDIPMNLFDIPRIHLTPAC